MVLNESQMSNWLFPSNALIGKLVPYRQRLQKDKYPISSLIAVFWYHFLWEFNCLILLYPDTH